MKKWTKAPLFGLLLGLVGLVTACLPTQASTPKTVSVSVVALSDFHGNLTPSNLRVPDPADPSKSVSLPAGGLESVGTLVRAARAQNPNTIFVGGGDLIGATPLISSLLRDEVTLEAFSTLGMEVSTLGNHEFDQGLQELRRMQGGGCNSNAPDRACKFNPQYAGAKFTYIAANVMDKATGQPAFPAYFIKDFGSVKVGFVGAVPKETPTIVSPGGVAGLDFTDEAEAINRVIPELKAKGVGTVVALIHGGSPYTGPFGKVDCDKLDKNFVGLVSRLDPAVGVVKADHVPGTYVCRAGGRLIVQGDAQGRVFSRIDLTLDGSTGSLIGAEASNSVVDPGKTAKDPAMTEIVTRAKALTDPVANQPVAKLGADQITRDQSPAGESALGDVIADSQLFATRDAAKGGAVIAFMNPGGIRANLPANPSPSVTYGDTFAVQPFGNTLVVLTLTGAQIKTLLEQQFDNPAAGQSRMLQVSEGFSYSWDAKAATGSKVSNMALSGTPIDPAKPYRVTVNSFLADGGDNFLVLKEGTDRLGGDLDLDAMQAYLKAQEQAGKPVGVTPRNRITAVNQ